FQASIFLRGGLKNLRSSVPRPVISRDHFIPRIIQVQECPQRPGKLLLLVARSKKNRYGRTIGIRKRRNIGDSLQFSRTPRHINRIKNPEKSGDERKGQREPMQRAISSTAQ